MKKRLIISERQVNIIKNYLNEENDHDIILNKIISDLNLNYETEKGTYRSGGEYFEKPMIKIKADDELITPKDLFDYLKFKYKLNSEFIKQVIIDWLNNNIKDNKLSKNISHI